MAVLTKSSSAGRRSVAAPFAIVLGLLGVAALPAAIYVAETRADIALIDAAYAIPFAVVLGLAALWLGGRARRKAQLSLSGRGETAARMGRALGLLAVLIGLTGALAVGWYAVLTWRSQT